MNQKPIPSLGMHYFVTDDGRVFVAARTIDVSNHPKQKTRQLPAQEKTLHIDSRGYVACAISVDGRTKHFRVHRLVLEAFAPQPDASALDVNHKNGIKTDNRLENLEWVTRGENLKHRYQVLKQKHSMAGKFGQLHHRSLPVIGLDAQGNKMCEFPALMEAQRAGYSASKISDCLSGKRATHKGLRWKAADLSSFI